MTAEIICVGTEILLGNIVNTNGAYLSERLASMGISVFFETTVGDNPKRLEQVIETALKRSDLLVLSGGLGPTKDDLTKEIAAKACGQKLVEDKQAKEELEYFFKMRNRPIAENNYKQAMVPEDCTVLYNPNGTAPGIMIHEKHGKKVLLLPGPPGELIPMFRDQAEPILRNLTPEIFYSKVMKIDCVGESDVETQILDLIEKQENPTIAPYAKVGEVHLRVTARASSKEQAEELIAPMMEELKKRFAGKYFTTDSDVTLEEAVITRLKEKNWTIAAAESCTGGMLSARLINVPGASDVMEEGLITYANKAKIKYLGVKAETLEQFGAVSKETAEEMARGAAKAADAQVGVGITGLAGPGGETAKKKPGLVYIGVCVNGAVKVNRYQFSGNREKIRSSAVSRALTMIRLALQ